MKHRNLLLGLPHSKKQILKKTCKIRWIKKNDYLTNLTTHFSPLSSPFLTISIPTNTCSNPPSSSLTG